MVVNPPQLLHWYFSPVLPLLTFRRTGPRMVRKQCHICGHICPARVEDGQKRKKLYMNVSVKTACQLVLPSLLIYNRTSYAQRTTTSQGTRKERVRERHRLRTALPGYQSFGHLPLTLEQPFRHSLLCLMLFSFAKTLEIEQSCVFTAAGGLPPTCDAACASAAPAIQSRRPPPRRAAAARVMTEDR